MTYSVSVCIYIVHIGKLTGQSFIFLESSFPLDQQPMQVAPIFSLQHRRLQCCRSREIRGEIIPLLSLQDAEGFNAVHHVHSMVLELQSKHEKLVQTTAELVNEYNRREKSLEELYGSIDRLEQNKADKKHVSQEIGIKVSQMYG